MMLTATAPRMDRVLSMCANGFHGIAYAEWGDPSRQEVAVCAHGLTRTGRDFDVLAEALTPYRRVLCPDVTGRGRSGWLPSAKGYNYEQYTTDMMVVIARSGASTVDWVGTSMGGLIGMILAAKRGSPIRRLVLNDVGPFISKEVLRRFGDYVGHDPCFSDLDEAEAYIRRVHAPFGPLTAAQWRHLTEHSVRPDPEGGYRLAYDPRIGEPFSDPEAIEDLDMWAKWDAVDCPVLILRGRESDVLTSETAAEMVRRGVDVDLVEFDGIGHAPALLDEEQVRVVVDWLAGRQAA